ncbi:TIM barrel protein [Tissierella sp. Yu-01]|uniref:sugar phosphate isomerase/epimerase family protein n=1 Tax=Tissierella sp. Yu-01 TaxID=3035694 RepID=UPI00240DA6E7|nr:TIM barrel protein [Tissierella sp. Yu-01]WFA10005.1 TIM barrel protein [Tissierella sp. Yu-01]
MNRDILKCINTINDFHKYDYDKLNVGVEIQDFTEPNLTNMEIEELVKRYKELFRDFKHTKALHGPFLDLKPSSPDEEIRRISYNKYLRTIKIAMELDINYVIFHSQINPYLKEPNLMELNNLQAREFWHSIAEEIIDYKGIILIENIFEETPEMIKDLIETIDLPNIKINFDIGHARLGTVTLENWIKELKDYLAYIHLHSNNGVFDLHCIPSDIEIMALNNLLNKYSLNPVISLEYMSDDVSVEIELLRR